MNYSLMHFLEYLLFSNAHFTVTSARRTPEQNKSCNGAPNSQHLMGEAIDIKPYGSTSFNKLLEMIHDYSDHFSSFDQLIIYPSFIHISFGPRNRRQVIDKRK
nr:MAG TPA_asm: peptidase [Microviridae sp.]